MTLCQVNNYTRYQAIVSYYGAKGCKNNNYIQQSVEDLINKDSLYELCGRKNAFLLEKKDGFWRVYYYINDVSEKLILDGEKMVTEILFRGKIGEPIDEVRYLESCGFKRNLVRDQYSAKHSTLTTSSFVNGINIEIAANIKDVLWAINLFNTTFDRLSGDYLPPECADNISQLGTILIAKDQKGTLLGALHMKKQKGISWLNHVAVIKDARGKGVGRSLVDAYIQNGYESEDSKYMLWVQHQNDYAVNLYQSKGFIYVNKSTLSMIRE